MHQGTGGWGLPSRSPKADVGRSWPVRKGQWAGAGSTVRTELASACAFLNRGPCRRRDQPWGWRGRACGAGEVGGAAFQSVWPGFNTLSFLARPRGRPSAPRTLTDILGRRSDYTPPFFLKILYIYFWREGKGKRKRGSETSIGCLSHTPPNWGPDPQPRHMPWLGIKPETFQFADWRSTHGATPARADDPHFTDEQVEAQGLHTLPGATELLGGQG